MHRDAEKSGLFCQLCRKSKTSNVFFNWKSTSRALIRKAAAKADAKSRLEALKSGASKTTAPKVEVEKPTVEVNETGIQIKKPTLKLK